MAVVGLMTSDRLKQFPANLPIGESLLSFKFAMYMCSYDYKILFMNLIHSINKSVCYNRFLKN